MRLPKIFLCLAALAMFSFTTLPVSQSNSGPWRVLGSKKVGFGVDRDVIHFSNWGDNVRELKLKVTDGPLKMYDMKIHYDNGTTQDVALKSRFAQGSESRVIQLEGGLRHLSKIEFTYETKGFLKGKAELWVYGRN